MMKTQAMCEISEQSTKLLREMAHEEGRTVQEMLDEAVKEHYRRWFFERVDVAYKALQADEEAWAEELREREEWDCTLMDGIDKDEVWHEDGSVTFEPPR